MPRGATVGRGGPGTPLACMFAEGGLVAAGGVRACLCASVLLFMQCGSPFDACYGFDGDGFWSCERSPVAFALVVPATNNGHVVQCVGSALAVRQEMIDLG